MQIDDTKSTKKRQSSEGVSNTAVEKKTKLEDIYLSEEPKEAVEEKVFSHRGGLHHEYVVPSNAGRTPIKVSVGASLKVSSSSQPGVNAFNPFKHYAVVRGFDHI